MPNFRYPIAPPSNGVSNPFTVEFDYLPHPIPVTLSDSQREDLYTTRITVSPEAAAAGADRIAHIFPTTHVRFLMTDSSGLSPEQLAEQYMDENGTSPLEIRGFWITMARPTDIRDIRRLVGNVFPTVIVYHDVIVNRDVIRNLIVPVLETSRVLVGPDGSETEIEETEDKLIHWITTDVTAKIVSSDNQVLPLIPPLGSVRSLRVSALMMEGTGIRETTLNKVRSDLVESLSNGTIKDADALVTMPLSYVFFALPNSELANSHRNHPLAPESVWPQNPAFWWGIVFANTMRARGSITQLSANRMFSSWECQINDAPKFPVPKSGLFFFYSTESSNTVRVYQKASGEIKDLCLFSKSGVPTVGTSIELRNDDAADVFQRVLVGKMDVPSGSDDHYFNVPRQMANLQQFIDEISVRHMTYFTTAGAFARMMGYLAETVANELSNKEITITETLTDEMSAVTTTYNIKVLPTASFSYFMAGAYRLLISSEHLGTQELMAGTGSLVFKLLLQSGIDLTSITRNDWMNSHEDGEEGTGWIVFVPSSNDLAGRKDHFLFNCMMRLVWSNPLYNLGVWISSLFEDDETDAAYNEKGEEFAEWGMSTEYSPEKVENWILTNLVERATNT